jgi:hypothetical protein
MGWHTFGGTYWADNRLYASKSLARYMTGGSPHNNGPLSGSNMNNDYATAMAHPQHPRLRRGPRKTRRAE